MDSLLDVNPGAIIWTIINFLVFFFIIFKMGGKAIVKGLKEREDNINKEINDAEAANKKAQEILVQAQEKIDNAQKEMAEIVAKGRKQAEDIVHKAAEDADKVKQAKIEESLREIDRQKDAAISELRTEVAGLVIEATEKILDEKLDKDKHIKLVESYIDKLPKN